MKDATPNYQGPNDKKHKPLDRHPCKRLIQAAIETENPLNEVCVRVPLSTGLRVDELVHIKAGNIDSSYSKEYEKIAWYVTVPPYSSCTGGRGPNENGQPGNPHGYNLHETGQPCSTCRERSVSEKDWLTEEQKKTPGFSPKTRKSIERYQWFLPGREELAKKFRAVCRANGGQFPVLQGSVNHRIRKVAREAGLEDSRSIDPDTGKLNITAHALRHTYGCKLGAQDEFNPSQIMAYTRHASTAIAEWYSNQWGERKRRAMASFTDEFS